MASLSEMAGRKRNKLEIDGETFQVGNITLRHVQRLEERFGKSFSSASAEDQIGVTVYLVTLVMDDAGYTAELGPAGEAMTEKEALMASIIPLASMKHLAEFVSSGIPKVPDADPNAVAPA